MRAGRHYPHTAGAAAAPADLRRPVRRLARGGSRVCGNRLQPRRGHHRRRRHGLQPSAGRCAGEVSRERCSLVSRSRLCLDQSGRDAVSATLLKGFHPLRIPFARSFLSLSGRRCARVELWCCLSGARRVTDAPRNAGVTPRRRRGATHNLTYPK